MPTANYWVVKGKPAKNDWSGMLRPGTTGTWRTAMRPKALSKGDRVFCWSSSPELRVVGVAEVVKADAGENDQGEQLFSIRYLSRQLANAPGIEELRKVSGLENASFLKGGPATTLLKLTPEQGEVLYGVLSLKCDEFPDVWPDLQFRVPLDPYEEDVAAIEGRRRLVQHFKLERNRKIVEKKKSLARGQLQCSVCGFDFEKSYGDRGRDFCEVHHIVPSVKMRALLRLYLRIS